jgi:uncharacterized protein
LKAVQSYDPKQHDIGAVFSSMIRNVIATNTGQKTALALLLSANPEIARELAPQLKFTQNSELGVYAMPNIYRGHADPVHDAELGKVSFCDIPWLFPESYSGPLDQNNLHAIAENLNDTQIRLPALGIDAYNVLNRLPELLTLPYAGATGRLSLNSENRITRKLVCAQFKGGQPVVTGPAE